jgi:hypothetical protein
MILAWDGGTPVLSQRTPDPELVGGDIVPDVPSIPSLVNIRGNFSKYIPLDSLRHLGLRIPFEGRVDA